MKEQTRLLLQLAGEAEAAGDWARAIKCLAPVCADGAGELPTLVAQARLKSASLLLAHYDNLQEAKALLISAEQALRATQGQHVLKCEVWSALARCHQRAGNVTAEADALSAGLKSCRSGAASKDKEALARWQAHFRFRLAEHAHTHEGPEAGAAALARIDGSGEEGGGAKPPPLTDLERVLLLLGRATLHLQAGEHTAASAAIEAANPLIEPTAGDDRQLYAQLHAHYTILLVSMVVLVGRINDLQQDYAGNVASLANLEELLGEVGAAPWAYPWLPTPAVGALGHLLHASLLRSLGKAAPAAAYLAAALEGVEAQLRALGIDLQAGELQLGTKGVWEGRIYCHLRVLIAEQQVLAALGASKFAAAAEQLVALTALLDRFPSLLRDCVPGVQMLLGHYAHSVQQYAAASARFQDALRSDATHLHDSAALAAALSELLGDRGPAGVRAATELLEARQLTELPHVLSLPVHDRTAALVGNALRHQRGGDDGNARLHLTKALKAAHAHLGNTQMVAQVLNMLAPMQAAKGDRAGAEQMLASATTLSKAQSDLPTLATASHALAKLFSEALDDAQRAGRQAEYAERKQGELAAAVAAAAATPAHAAALAWRPPAAK